MICNISNYLIYRCIQGGGKLRLSGLCNKIKYQDKLRLCIMLYLAKFVVNNTINIR